MLTTCSPKLIEFDSSSVNRMAGKHISLLRLVRLLPPLRTTVTVSEFTALNLFRRLIWLIFHELLGKYLFVMGRVLYPPMRVLRLADMKTAIMDKLLFYVRQTSKLMPKYLAEAETVAKSFLTDDVKAAMTRRIDKSDVPKKVIADADNHDLEESESDESEEEEDQAGDNDSSIDDEYFCKWPGDSLTHRVMRIWEKRKDPLVHSYSLVGHLCSPNPVIIDDAINAMSTHISDYEQAVEDLLKKLILDPSLVGEKRKEQIAYLIDEFWKDLNHFQFRTGPYNRDHIWISVAKEDTLAYRWHQRNSLGGRTISFGPLACLVASKPGGGGSCERNWKQYKQAKTGKRNKLGGEKTKKQVAVYGRHQYIKGQLRSKSLATAHKLWEEEDFDTMKMDAYCSEIITSLKPIENDKPRIFRA